MQIKFIKTKNVKTPQYGSEGANGIDFYIPESYPRFSLQPGQSISIPSGIKVELPEGWCLLAVNKSGIAKNQGLQVGACLVDSDYRGEIHLHVTNISNQTQPIKQEQKLVQFMFLQAPQAELVEVKEFTSETTRGEGGFGSTGLY